MTVSFEDVASPELSKYILLLKKTVAAAAVLESRQSEFISVLKSLQSRTMGAVTVSLV